MVKSLINRHNRLLLTCPYQHFNNAIENWFSVFKSHMQKEETLRYDDMVASVPKALSKIKLQSYMNIIRYTYDRNPMDKPKESQRYHRVPKKYKE